MFVDHLGQVRRRTVSTIPIGHRSPVWQRHQPVVVEAVWIVDEVVQDIEGQGALQVVACRIGQNGDADLQLRQPPEIREKPKTTTAVRKEHGLPSPVPLRPGHSQGIPFQAALCRSRYRAHLVEQRRIEQARPIEAALVELELDELRHVIGTGV